MFWRWTKDWIIIFFGWSNPLNRNLKAKPCVFLYYQGQYCDICTSEDTNRAHPISNAIDGTERWWQSPPLSRSVKYNEVNVTLDLGQVCCRCIPYNLSSSITQRTVESSDTRLQQALLWMTHECWISRVDPKLNIIHSYSSLEYVEEFFVVVVALNTSPILVLCCYWWISEQPGAFQTITF